MKKLEGKIALVTEACSGNGLAIARRFVKEGAYVYITGRRLETLRAAMEAPGERMSALQGDVGNLVDLARFYEKIKAEKGRLDIVVAHTELVQDQDPGPVKRCYPMIFNNFAKGVIFPVQMALPLVHAGGVILLIDSIAGDKVFTPRATYSVYKASIQFFARAWATSLNARRIKVNVLSPGTFGPRGSEKYVNNIVLPRGRTRPNEIARTAVLLSSADMTQANIKITDNGKEEKNKGLQSL